MHKNSVSLARTWQLITLALLPCVAQAAWTLHYDGPDVLILMSRPNAAATNTRSAYVERREVSKQAVALLLAPAVEDAFAKCDLSDIDEVVIKPGNFPDRLGDTTTHLEGIGMYVSMSPAAHSTNTTWFIAPYFALQVQLMSGGRAINSSDTLFAFETWPVA